MVSPVHPHLVVLFVPWHRVEADVEEISGLESLAVYLHIFGFCSPVHCVSLPSQPNVTLELVSRSQQPLRFWQGGFTVKLEIGVQVAFNCKCW